MKNLYYYFLVAVCLLGAACKKDTTEQIDTGEDPVWYNNVLVLSPKDLNAEQIYKDGDSWDQVKNLTFRVNKPIQITGYDKSHFQITNFVPMDIANVYVTMRMSDADIVLVKLDTLKAHTRMVVEYPFSKKKRFFGTNGNPYALDEGSIDLENAVGLTFDVFGINNETLDKIKSIKCQWNITFNGIANSLGTSFTPEAKSGDGNYTSRPLQMRLFTNLMLNLAYTMSLPDFREELYAHQMYLCKAGDPVFPDRLSYTGQGWTWFTDATNGSPTTTYASNKEVVDVVLTRLYSQRFVLHLGICGNGGLASVSNYGGMHLISDGCIRSTYSGKDPGDTPYRYQDPLLNKLVGYLPDALYSNPMALFAHELGHNLGFGHNSNFCSTGQMTVVGEKENAYYGFPAAGSYIYNREMRRGRLLINENQYYRPQDFKGAINADVSYTSLPTYSSK